MESTLAPGHSRGWMSRYGVAVAAPVVALIARLLLTPVLSHNVPYATFLLSTAVSAVYGGLGPGVVATGVGSVLALVFVLPPSGTFRVSDLVDIYGFVLFLGVSGLISFLAGRLNEERTRADALRLFFEQTLRSIGDAVISTGYDRRVRVLNAAAEQLTGWREAEARGRPVGEVFRIVREGSDEPAHLPLDEVLASGTVVGLANHTELITRGGERIAIDDSAAPIRDRAGHISGAVIVFRDVRERRRTEQALEASERRSRGILESISDAFLLLDTEWRVVQLNATAESMLGAPAAALVGRNYWEISPAAAGTQIEEQFRAAVGGHTPAHLEVWVADWNGGGWFDVRAYPSAEGLAVYAREISDRKRQEQQLRRLNEDLQQFTFAATHDLREPLRMILVYAQLLEKSLPATNAELSDFLRHILSGAHRMTNLIDGLLEFSRLGQADPAAAASAAPVDTQAALDEALGNLHVALNEHGGQVHRHRLPPVIADKTHLCQLFQNLVGNALKYRAPDRRPRVEISAEREGGQWVFSVADNGVGIDPEHHARIFAPFERLHGAEITGAGIGLATCKRIVERYGGRIWVESRPGEGATFRFSLPAAAAESSSSSSGKGAGV